MQTFTQEDVRIMLMATLWEATSSRSIDNIKGDTTREKACFIINTYITIPNKTVCELLEKFI